MIKAVLFDLDGTLLPMDQEVFTNGYFRFLAHDLCPLGITPEEMVRAVWAGCKQMALNDGTRSNKECFWECFSAMTGKEAAPFIPVADHFYGDGFYQAKQFTSENPLAKEAVRLAGNNGRTVALATNPLFPMVGQRTRLDFLGLKESDFALVTCYESDSYCKPNPAYFTSVCDRLKVTPEDTLMIGNDEKEDMWAASQAGLQGYLVTDCLIPCPEHPWDGPRGSFAEMTEMLRGL